MTVTQVDENCLLLVCDVESSGSRTPVLLHWTGNEFTASSAHVLALAKYEALHPEVAEVWFVYPEDLQVTMTSLRSLKDYKARTSANNPLAHRFFLVDVSGAWVEQSASAPDHVQVTPEVMQSVREDGMRQIFRDSDAIASASAGYHFEHPGGKHSEYFLRTAQAVARTQHAYFIAMCLLPLVTVVDRARFWADTAGILPALSALRDLLIRLSSTAPEISVDSFGGHKGREALRPAQQDFVFISSSTSGNLGAALVAEKKARAERLVTLYLLSGTRPEDIKGLVACDLTDRDPNPIRSRRTSRFPPHMTATIEDCEHCAAGHGVTVLDGDGFFPNASDLRLRMPSIADRPRTVGDEVKKGRLEEFDGDTFFDDFYGLDAIRPRTLTSSDDLTTTVAHLFPDHPSAQHIRNHLASVLDSMIDPNKPILAIRALADEDSRALAQFAADHVLEGAVKDEKRDVWVHPEQSTNLQDLPANSTVLVCAGVIASGRSLLSMNRELRSLPDNVDTAYLLGIAHSDVTGWDILQKTLGVRSTDEKNRVGYGWLLPRELRQPGLPNAWGRERRVLDVLDEWLSDQPDSEALRKAVQDRYTILSNLTADNLFPGAANDAIWALNRRFALWKKDWKTHPRTVALNVHPTHAEVMVTVAHLMFESRRSNTSLDHVRGTTKRHGYALNPAMFDRFNDPMLQAAILRCAEPGELDYSTSVEPSRVFADIVLYALQHITEQGGDSSYEFLLALATPFATPGSPGAILEASSLASLLDGAAEAGGGDFGGFPPRVRALLLFLRAKRASA
ncbi:hypothetical protein [Microbacterium profundi]|uniref:hypothetical protein n=1 Tax=Microbacterium profundi TaxID=450380 RepID=UPI00051A1BEF|nr:hypothetical protein [Microbacterium profundi]